ncbi:MAG: hypothetical protein V4692_07740, partial [Bdellovibrionota bacterium]
MDIMAVLRYVSDHNETVFGTLVVLFLITAMLLLIRQIGSRRTSDAGNYASGGSAIINVEEIETALKRVLSSQSGGHATPSAEGAAAPNPA